MEDAKIQLTINDTTTYHKGHITQKENKVQVEYEMLIDERMIPVIFSIEEDRILLTQENYTMIFKEDEKNEFICKTPYGDLTLSTQCKEMIREDGEVTILYELYDGDHLIEERKIQLKYEKEN